MKTSASITKRFPILYLTNFSRAGLTGCISAPAARAACASPSSISAQHRGGICFCVDLDPRWVIKLIKRGDIQEAERYKQHCIDQALTLLRAHEIHCMFTTPKLLEALAEKINLRSAGIKGIFCGGTEMTPQFHRFAKEELLGDEIYFAPTYGNTLMGLAVHKPFDIADNYAVIYYPPSPRAMIEVVDPDNPTDMVDYGKTGRVRLTTLTKEFFMPRFLRTRRMRARTTVRKVPLGRRSQCAAVQEIPNHSGRGRVLNVARASTRAASTVVSTSGVSFSNPPPARRRPTPQRSHPPRQNHRRRGRPLRHPH